MQPLSSVIRSANSSERSWIAAARRSQSSARSAAGRCRQSLSSNARRAAATAASMSAGEAEGTEPIRSSEWGDTTSKVSDDSAGRHAPSMNNDENSRCSMLTLPQARK